MAQSAVDIHSYLIDTPSLYSKENLKSYTTLDAYGYVTRTYYYMITTLKTLWLLRLRCCPAKDRARGQ